jgi:putative membrane protein
MPFFFTYNFILSITVRIRDGQDLHDDSKQGSRTMKIISRIAGVVLFILFFGFALKNTQEVALSYFFGYEMRGPLVLLLLGFFCAGAALGILAMLPTLVRHRRELARQQKLNAGFERERVAQQQVRAQPPQPDSVVNK